MANPTLEVIVRMRDLLSRQLTNLTGKTEGATRKMASAWQRLRGAIFSVKGAVTGFMAVWVTGRMWNWVQAYANLERAQIGFSRLAKAAGVDATQALNDMRAATRDTVGDVDLLTEANRALVAGFVKTKDDLKLITDLAYHASRSMGGDAAQWMGTLTTAITQGEAGALRRFGIGSDLEGYFAAWEQETGRALNTETRTRLIIETLLKRRNELLKDGAKIQTTTQDQVDRTKKYWGDIQESMGATWAIALDVGVPVLRELAQRAEDVAVATGKTINLWRTLQSLRKGVVETLKPKEPVMPGLIDLGTEDVVAPSGAEPTEVPAVRNFWHAMQRAAEDYRKYAMESLDDWRDTVLHVFRDIENSISTVFFDAMMGKMQSFKEYLRAFIADVARTISQFFSRQLVSQVLGAMGVAGAGAVMEPAGYRSTGYGTGTIDAKAAGGIVYGPQRTLIGEAGPEAVVPLPNGRSIPVEMRGGGGGPTVNIVVNANDVDSFRNSLHTVKRDVLAILREGVGQDMRLRRDLRGALA